MPSLKDIVLLNSFFPIMIFLAYIDKWALQQGVDCRIIFCMFVVRIIIAPLLFIALYYDIDIKFIKDYLSKKRSKKRCLMNK